MPVRPVFVSRRSHNSSNFDQPPSNLFWRLLWINLQPPLASNNRRVKNHLSTSWARGFIEQSVDFRSRSLPTAQFIIIQ
jgi:hypothetical protein